MHVRHKTCTFLSLLNFQIIFILCISNDDAENVSTVSSSRWSGIFVIVLASVVQGFRQVVTSVVPATMPLMVKLSVYRSF